MKTLFINGKIFSANKNNDFFQVIGIRENIIDFLGYNKDIKNINSNYDSIIDLNGKLVVPGFNDSHIHLLGYGYAKDIINLNNCKSFYEIIKTSKDYISKHKYNLPKVILGRGWNQDNLVEKLIPTKEILDKISTNIPIIFTRACGHIAVCNSKALNLLCNNFNENILQNNLDFKNGIVKEDGLTLLNTLVENPTLNELKEMILSTCDELIINGITSVQSDDFCALPKRDCKLVLQAFQDLASENKLPVRVYEQCLFSNINEFKILVNNKDLQFHSGNNFFKLGPLKLLLDGALGGRTAYLNNPYKDDLNNYGISNLSKEELDEFVNFANKNKIQIAVHAIGDKAIDWVLDSYDKFTEKHNPLRHGIIHCQLTTEKSLKKMADLNTLAYIQPIFLNYDIHIVENRIGYDNAKFTYAFNTMNNIGINISSGSDAPVEHFNVLNGIYCAVNRKDLCKYPKNGWFNDECLSVLDSVKSFTINGSYASFDDKIKGSLEKGKLADLVVLSKNIFEIHTECIKDTSVLLTMIDGIIRYNNL